MLCLEYPSEVRDGARALLLPGLMKSVPTLLHCQQARPYPGVFVGGTPRALPNSPQPPSGNALPFLVASPLSARGQRLPLSLALFFPLLVLQQQDTISPRALPIAVPKARHLPALSSPDREQPADEAYGQKLGGLPACLRSMAVPGSQSLNCTIFCWGPGSGPHTHHFELYFYQSARCKAPMAGRVGSWGKLCPGLDMSRMQGTTAKGIGQTESPAVQQG